jgi:hypothetical protein
MSAVAGWGPALCPGSRAQGTPFPVTLRPPWGSLSTEGPPPPAGPGCPPGARVGAPSLQLLIHKSERLDSRRKSAS